MWNALASGLAGACTVTLLNETIRQLDAEAPRLDLLGMQAVNKVADPDDLRTTAMAGDLLSNTLYYSMVATSPAEEAPLCGTALGVTAGIGAVMVPRRVGLSDHFTNRDAKRRALSVAYYTIAGLVAGLVYSRLARR